PPTSAMFTLAPTLHVKASTDSLAQSSDIDAAVDLRRVLCVSRFAQHLVALRDLVGETTDAQEVEARLSSWLLNYVQISNVKPDVTDTARPLFGAKLDTHASEAGNIALLVVAASPAYRFEDAVHSVRITFPLRSSERPTALASEPIVLDG